MEHFKLFVARINIPKVGYIWSCDECGHLTMLCLDSRTRVLSARKYIPGLIKKASLPQSKYKTDGMATYDYK
jgi:hypothetical protein